MPRAIGIIPARYGSTRLPGKPLVSICGKPLIYWVWSQAKKAKSLNRVIVATDDIRVKKAVEKFGGEAILTSSRFASGSDRVAWVAKKIKCDVVVNIQGDEPLVSPAAINALVKALNRDKNARVATLAFPIGERSILNDKNIVKVVFDKNSSALYFSRHSIPFSTPNGHKRLESFNLAGYYGHMGIYAFRKDFLLKFVGWKPSPLERLEKLEQLRILENGFPIKVVKVNTPTHSVDTPGDIKIVERLLKKRHER